MQRDFKALSKRACRAKIFRVCILKIKWNYWRGYTAIPVQLQTSQLNTGLLAVTQLDNALFGLQEIKIILFVLTVGLLGASLLVTLYVARELARPLEKLRLCPESSNRHATKRVTDSLKSERSNNWRIHSTAGASESVG